MGIYSRMSLIAVTFGFSIPSASASEDTSIDRPLIVAFGDSITTGFNAQFLFDNFNFSWSTGTSVTAGFKSQVERIRQETGLDYDRKNLAVAGARSAAIKSQIEGLGIKVPQIATLLIGANDVCNWSEDYAEARRIFASDIRQSIELLITKNPDVRILMAPIPNVGRLYELGSTHGCQALWNITGSCSSLLGGERTPAERQAFMGRLNALNGTLEDVAASFPQEVHFAAAIAEIPFEWEHVSRIDCFHPSVAGQGFLSQTVWNSGWMNP